jgi:L-ascorbate metabolism protein UlaG (beta-lactamase superfamily)
MTRVKKIMIALLTAALALGAFALLQYPKFGSNPAGGRLERIKRSPQYANGVFHNQIATPVLAGDTSTFEILTRDLFEHVENLRPDGPVPVTKTNLKSLDPEQDTIVWLGHSSFFVQLAGKRILIDPVFSLYASPVPFSIRAFAGTSLYSAHDMPAIDMLLITHDHWDHLDYATLTALKDRVGQALVPLGVGAHLESWGYAPAQIHEADWYDKLAVADRLTIHLIPARHYSGRGLTRSKTLWGGYVLESGDRRILFSGDTGYGPHFKQLAQRFGSFDLVALDMGQYDPRWPFIHMNPEQAAQAAEVLHAKALLPAHAGKFNLARHAWNEPFERITAASGHKSYRLATPKIGEALRLDQQTQRFSKWWEDQPSSLPKAENNR